MRERGKHRDGLRNPSVVEDVRWMVPQDTRACFNSDRVDHPGPSNCRSRARRSETSFSRRTSNAGHERNSEIRRQVFWRWGSGAVSVLMGVSPGGCAVQAGWK